jgi:histidinol-phosphatase (PHP family)
MKKWDGHTHTEYCPHGTVTDMEEMIQKAIRLGFTHYSITEHAPLPIGFQKQCAGPAYPIVTGGMVAHDFEHYLSKVERLKKKYASEIQIYLGVELDYLPGFESWTKSFLEEYGVYLEDSILSVHFLNGIDGIRAIDYTAKDFQEGILSYYGDFQSVQAEYLKNVYASLQVDLGKYKPRRIGHVSLIRKFIQSCSSKTLDFSEESLQWYEKIFSEMEKQRLMLDFNMAGLFKEDCKETYPPVEILKQYNPQITFVYGSDSHDISDLARGYNKYIEKRELLRLEHIVR